MKKPVLAAIALLFVGTAAFAAVRIGVYGVCPLTGKPIHCSKSACSQSQAPASEPVSRP